MKKFVLIFSIIMGIYWTICGFGYGFWVRKGPGGGFFPVLAGIMAVIFGSLMLINSRKDKSSSAFPWKTLLPVAAIVMLMLCSYLVGLIISIAIYVFLWLKFIEKYKILNSLIIGICCAAIIYGIFVVWLQVPLPTGMLGIL